MSSTAKSEGRLIVVKAIAVVLVFLMLLAGVAVKGSLAQPIMRNSVAFGHCRVDSTTTDNCRPFGRFATPVASNFHVEEIGDLRLELMIVGPDDRGSDMEFAGRLLPAAKARHDPRIFDPM
ncbi:MAG: hypothetical protein ACRDFW_04640 [bacterium]